MLWTPSILPPHPTSMSTLSPFAQKLIDLIQEEAREQRPIQPQTNQYRARILNNNLSRSILENNLLSRNEEDIIPANGIFDDHNLKRTDSTLRWNNVETRLSTPRQGTTMSFDNCYLTTGIHQQYLNQDDQISFRSNKQLCSQNEQHEVFGSELPPPSKDNQTEDFDIPNKLSPDMEFDNMEIFSVPYTKNPKSPIIQKTFLIEPSFDSNFTSSPQAFKSGSSLNFKEIKRSSWQRQEQLLNNKKLRPEPTDQTFIFNEKPKNDNYKSKLGKYKSINIGNNYGNTSDQIPKRTSNVKTADEKNHCKIDNQFKVLTYQDQTCAARILTTPSSINMHMGNNVTQLEQVNLIDNDISETSYINFENEVLNNIELSENVESLFVKTQDYALKDTSDIENENMKSNDFNVFSEDTSLLPSQRLVSSDNSTNFEVDDLFSFEEVPQKITQNVPESLEKSLKYNKIALSRENIQSHISKDDKENNSIKVNIENGTKSVYFLNTDSQNCVQQNHISLIKICNSSIANMTTYKKQYNDEDDKNYEDISLFDNNMKTSSASLKQVQYLGKEITANKKNKYDTQSIYSNNNKLTKNSSKKNYSIEYSIETYKDKVQKQPARLKQTTLFECRKFLSSDCKKDKNNDFNGETQDSRSEFKFNGFKKPKLPTSNYSTKQSKTQPKNSPEQNLFINSNKRKMKDETPNKLKTSKSIQSVLIQPEYKQSLSTSQNKPIKKPRFVAPLAVTHSTSHEIALKNYTITVLNNVCASEILERLATEELKKVLVTITFKEGYTLLNKPVEQIKNSQCFPSGVMFLAHWTNSRKTYYWLHLLDFNPTDSSVLTVVNHLLTKPEQIVCFESQAVFMLLMDIFHQPNTSSWYALDPLVGCWLLDPDNPPKDFLETCLKLDIDKRLLVVNPNADTKTQACDLLPVLEVAMDILKQRLTNASLWTLFCNMEMRLTPLLAAMESSSIVVDVHKLHETAAILDIHLKQLEKEAHKITNRSFLINSHQQLRQILYDELKLDTKFNIIVKQTEKGSKSTSEAVLLQFKDLHPLPKIILDYRHLQKVKSTYVDGLIQQMKTDGTIRTTWEQVGAATGRITSKNPNLQAIPKVPVTLPNGEKIQLRAVFKARKGYSFLAADFQQIEFRVFAHFTQDNNLIQAFREGGDIFQQLASQWLGGAGPAEREKTKRIVYAVMYGAGPHKVAENLQVDLVEANRIINNFVDIFPSLRSMPKTVIAQCSAQGYITSLSGRRRLFPHIRATSYKLRSYTERQAMNFLIQGSAVDICKAAMLNCEAALKLKGLNAKLLLQIHDELVWEVADEHLQETAREVRTAMEHQWDEKLTLRVPVPVCVTSGKTLANMLPINE